jgi:hypothetical protein
MAQPDVATGVDRGVIMKKLLKILAICTLAANMAPTVLGAEKKAKPRVTTQKMAPNQAQEKVRIKDLVLFAGELALMYAAVRSLDNLDLSGLKNLERDMKYCAYACGALIAGAAIFGAYFYHQHANPMCII